MTDSRIILHIGEGGVQSTLFSIFNQCYLISSPNKLKMCHTIKQLYIRNIMPKHEIHSEEILQSI